MNFEKVKNKITQKNALVLSVVIICIFWAAILYAKLSDVSKALTLDKNIFDLLLYVLISGAIEIPLICVLLYLSRETPRDVGIKLEKLKSQIYPGIFLGALIFLVKLLVLDQLTSILLPSKSTGDAGDITYLFKNLYHLPIWIFLTVFGGGFLEELERVFMLTRFEKLFGRYGLLFCLVASSTIFGLCHLYQGYSAVITTAILGLLFGMVYLRKRSTIEAMTAHAVYDLIGLILAYVLYYGK